MTCFIVPNDLRDAIYRKIDEQLVDHPCATKEDREYLYHQLLDYFNEHGTIPDFTIQPKETPDD